MVSAEFHRRKREQYRKLLTEGCMGFVFCGEEKQKAGDENYPFCPYMNFYYLTGYEKPGTVYMAYHTTETEKELLFIERPEEIRERFEGKMPTASEVKEAYGVDEVKYLDELERFIGYIAASGSIHTCYIDQERSHFTQEKDALSVFVEKLLGNFPYLSIKNSYPHIVQMRKIKDAEEIALHRKACDVTTQGVKYMISHMKPEMTEGQIEAYFDFVLKSNGCGHAFDTVAAAGANACTLHYSANSDIVKDGDMILFDLGASSGYYCADVSRTYPVNGKFTMRQRQLYEIVLKGLEAALEAAKPGANKDRLQLISKKVMAEELMKIGMIEKEEDISRYYLHGSGHFIGLYTHDVGEHPDNVLVENTMFTLEPGLYFPEEKIGIRIEDTLLVTKDGCEVLTAGIPKTIEEIEAFLRKE